MKDVLTFCIVTISSFACAPACNYYRFCVAMEIAYIERLFVFKKSNDLAENSIFNLSNNCQPVFLVDLISR